MKKTEFMEKLAEELRKRKIADITDVLEEYEQHFAFRMAAGYSEEEIAAGLGAPSAIAAQFDETQVSSEKHYSKALPAVGLCFSYLLFGMLLLLFVAVGIAAATASLSFAVLAVCLLCKLNIADLIPAIPYGCAVVLALASAAFSLLLLVVCLYYIMFLRRFIFRFGQFHKKATADIFEKDSPSSSLQKPMFSVKTKRRLRIAARVLLLLFLLLFALSYVICSLSAGSFAFWHAWGWFQN